jgi:DNA-nicking Smr family endonuclease
MSRRLTPEEEALWRAVVANVRPLAAPARADLAAAPAPLAPLARAGFRPPDRTDVGSRKSRPMVPPTPAPVSADARETLDAGWDRRLASGKTRPDRVIDLHGLTRAEARDLLMRAVQTGARRGERLLLVITGKGGRPGPDAIDLMQGRPLRGAIRADLPRWLAEPGIGDLIAAVRQAHGRQGGSGAVWLVLRRASRTDGSA